MTERDLGEKILVVNADDLGLSEGVDRGIERAHRDGIVTSASLMTNLPSFAHALEVARRCPALGVGIHLTVTCGPPLTELPPEIRGAGPLRLLAAASLSPRARTALRRELARQVERALEAGVRVTHLDSHHNVHAAPAVRRCVDEVAREFGIRWVRFRAQSIDCVDPVPGAGIRGISNRAKLGVLRALGGGSTDRSMRRILGAPQLDVESFEEWLAGALASLRPGITEIACHPGELDPEALRIDRRNRSREREIDALTGKRVKTLLWEHGIVLAHYGQLGH